MSRSDDRLRECVGRILLARKGSKARSRALDALGRLLVGEYRPRLIRFAERILRTLSDPGEDARDVTADLIDQVIVRPELLEGKGSAEAWLFVSLRNRCLSLLRQRGREVPILDDLGPAGDPRGFSRRCLEEALARARARTDHWLWSAEGRAIEAEESRLVLLFALYGMVTGTQRRIPSGKRLREELFGAVEASQIELLEMLARERVPKKLRERYFDAMLLYLRYFAGLSVKQAWQRLQWVLPCEGGPEGGGSRTPLVFDKKEKDRVNARAARARDRLKRYLLASGYRMGVEL